MFFRNSSPKKCHLQVYQSFLENIDGSDYEALCGLVQAGQQLLFEDPITKALPKDRWNLPGIVGYRSRKGDRVRLLAAIEDF